MPCISGAFYRRVFLINAYDLKAKAYLSEKGFVKMQGK
jgi:hypothetical protein